MNTDLNIQISVLFNYIKVSKNKHVINDPVFGFITIPNSLIYSIIKHPYLQRLNRIKQLGMASFAYPGAQHTRFNHSLGAMYLMQEAIMHLRAKGNEISHDEANAALACILMHDIGHGPFSHVLEHTIVSGVHHEEISLILMNKLNEAFDGQLDLCISIFKNEYPKKFLHQLVSGQLDVDRLDYLGRDSFFTGVTEGNIGSERLLKLMDVCEGNLVIEAKGIYSIENFLLTRRLMYWQVYHHKTAVAAECVLINTLKRAKELFHQGVQLFAPPALYYFLKNDINQDSFSEEAIHNFINLDDSDILSAVKVWIDADDFVLSKLSQCFVDRHLFKIEITPAPISENEKNNYIKEYIDKWNISEYEANYFIVERSIITNVYNEKDNSINLLYNNGVIKNILEASDLLNIQLLSKNAEKYYLAYMNI